MIFLQSMGQKYPALHCSMVFSCLNPLCLQLLLRFSVLMPQEPLASVVIVWTLVIIMASLASYGPFFQFFLQFMQHSWVQYGSMPLNNVECLSRLWRSVLHTRFAEVMLYKYTLWRSCKS